MNIKKKIELNEEFRLALGLLENTNEHIFLTGKAGTGKSTLLELFRRDTKKNIVVLAPTGVAAVNVSGQTIHSFFGFKPDITLAKVKKSRKEYLGLFERLETLIIDEVSMVRADLLDCVDKALKKNRGRKEPFGGVQMVFIGDLYQLPPVVTSAERELFRSHYKSPYFFDAASLKKIGMRYIELMKVYRQHDSGFANLLNAIRNNTVTPSQLKTLNSRVIEFEDEDLLKDHVLLTSRNAAAESMNLKYLSRLEGEPSVFAASSSGEFKKEYYPAEHSLQLKAGARVMLLNNDRGGRWVNGTIAEVRGAEQDENGTEVVYVELPDGSVEAVYRNKWELFRFKLNEKGTKIESEAVGEFTQYPLKLAWAMTIHKSQGKTFEKVVIDASGGIFAHGQVYVALSRCTSFEGMRLTVPLEKKHILLDWRVVKFITNYQYGVSEDAMPEEEKLRIINEVITSGGKIKIKYLKANGEKTCRVVFPSSAGEMSFKDKKFLGFIGHCSERREKRTFRVDRILEMEVI